MTIVPTIWQTSRPSEWATSPEWMNLHYLVDAERCPRAVVLGQSTYKDLWPHRGYPEKPNQLALSGRIIHSTARRIVSVLMQHNCESIRDSGAIEALKSVGGYSSVISRETEQILASLEGNPRFARLKMHLTRVLRGQMPRIRERVQVLLSRLSWASPMLANRSDKSENGSVTTKRARSALPKGTHWEVELIDRVRKWKGIADLVQIATNSCTITDFKTGNKSESHKLQLQIYALLWREDTERNPNVLEVRRLVLSYPDKDELLPLLTSRELDELREQIRIRDEAVRKSVNSPMPEARISPENCKACPVRLLCDEYWTPGKRGIVTTARSTADDMEVYLLEQRSGMAWEAECRISNVIPAKKRLMLRLAASDQVLQGELKQGNVLRLTDVYVVAGEADEMPLVQVTTNSEPLFTQVR